jgi:hypothetical protein
MRDTLAVTIRSRRVHPHHHNCHGHLSKSLQLLSLPCTKGMLEDFREVTSGYTAYEGSIFIRNVVTYLQDCDASPSEVSPRCRVITGWHCDVGRRKQQWPVCHPDVAWEDWGKPRSPLGYSVPRSDPNQTSPEYRPVFAESDRLSTVDTIFRFESLDNCLLHINLWVLFLSDCCIILRS